MRRKLRWDRCVSHRASAAEGFLADFFKATASPVGWSGTGFDPRSARVAELLSRVAPGRIRGPLLREERPSPHGNLVASAEKNDHRLRELVPGGHYREIRCFRFGRQRSRRQPQGHQSPA